MPKNVQYEIHIRKGDQGGPFHVKDVELLTNFGEMCAIAKKLVDDGECDESVVVEKRMVRRFKKYNGEG